MCVYVCLGHQLGSELEQVQLEVTPATGGWLYVCECVSVRVCV